MDQQLLTTFRRARAEVFIVKCPLKIVALKKYSLNKLRTLHSRNKLSQAQACYVKCFLRDSPSSLNSTCKREQRLHSNFVYSKDTSVHMVIHT